MKNIIFILAIFILLLPSCGSSPEQNIVIVYEGPIFITIEFKYPADNANIYHNFANQEQWEGFEMSQGQHPKPGKFEFFYQNDMNVGTYVFNIGTLITPEWTQYAVVPHGIRAVKITINDTIINDNFIAIADDESAYIAFDINQIGNISPSNICIGNKFPKSIPPECLYPVGYKNYDTPPQSYRFVTGIIHFLNDPMAPKHLISEVKIYSTTIKCQLADGNTKILHQDIWDKPKPMSKYYGLYRLSPWFIGGKLAGMPHKFENGAMICTPHTHPDNVWHFWSSIRTEVPADAVRTWLEVDCELKGVMIQCGLDAYPDVQTGSNIELGAGDWYGPDMSRSIIHYNMPLKK